jgi:hypothetical protein
MKDERKTRGRREKDGRREDGKTGGRREEDGSILDKIDLNNT